MSVYEVTVEVAVRVDINDERVLLRVTENRDGEDRPEGSEGWVEAHSWRKTLYDFHTAEDVAKHLAYNAVMNGVENANRLDGYADLDREAATAVIDRDSWYVESVVDVSL